MKKVSASLSALLLAGVLTQAQAAPALQLTSPDVREGRPLAAASRLSDQAKPNINPGADGAVRFRCRR